MDSGVLQQIASVFRNKSEIRASLQAYLEEQKEKQLAVKIHRNELEKQLAEAKQKQTRIMDMFLAGVVDQSNAKLWNSELAATRQSVELLEKEITELSVVPEIVFDDIFSDLMKAAEEWTKKIASGEADFATKRNLIMSVIESLECVERSDTQIGFKMKLVMSSSCKWWAMTDSNRRHSRCKRDALTN